MINCRWHANVDSERDHTDTFPGERPRSVWLVDGAAEVYGTHDKALEMAVRCVQNSLLKIAPALGRQIVVKLLADGLFEHAVWLFNSLVAVDDRITVLETTIR